MDPRSDALDTEFGMRNDCPALAEEASAFFGELMQHAAFQVRLQPGSDSALEWRRIDSDPPVVMTGEEPGADLATRVKLYLQSLVIPESML